MKRPIDVLVLENRRGNSRAAVAELEAAGHRVHRCRAPEGPAFPCRGVEDLDGCPLDGPVDVALVVRTHVHPSPSVLEDGVSCAIRAGVPVVEDGSDILDPYVGWITSRVGSDHRVVPAVEQAIDRGFAPLAADVLRRCAPILAAANVEPHAASCQIDLVWPKLQVSLEVPAPMSPGDQEALAVRALDAVRAGRRSFDKVNVQVHETRPFDPVQ